MAIQKLIFSCLFLAASFFSGWVVNGWRHESEISDIKAQYSHSAEAASREALALYNSMESKKNAAIHAAERASDKNSRDAATAIATVKRLRAEISGLQDRIATSSRAAVDQYAATAGELFGLCTEEYQRMAEEADRHRVNEQMILSAWPRNAPAQTEK